MTSAEFSIGVNADAKQQKEKTIESLEKEIEKLKGELSHMEGFIAALEIRLRKAGF